MSRVPKYAKEKLGKSRKYIEEEVVILGHMVRLGM